MIKRLRVFTLAILLIGVFFTACSKDNTDITSDESNEIEAKKLQDGYYLVKMPVSDHGTYPMGQMEIEDGKIISFDYMEMLASAGEEKNYDNYNYPDCIKVIKDLNQQFNHKKKLKEVDFDALSGATDTKTDFKEVVNQLLEKASKGEVYQPAYIDGEYEAKADEPVHGWLAEVLLKVKYGQIVGLDYYEVAVEDTESNKAIFDEDNKPLIDDDGKPETELVQVKAGDKKSLENYAYLDSFEVVKGVKKLIIDNNGTEDLNLDGITGATNTRTAIIELVEKALKDAK